MKLRTTLFIVIMSYSLLSTAQTTTVNNQKLTKITDRIYMLQDKGGNIGLSFGEDGIFMIDDQFNDNITTTQKTIASINKQPVQFLINTHHHGDHTGGNLAMANTGTVIVSQDNVRKRLNQMLIDKKRTSDAQLLPMVTFNEDMNFHYNGEQIYIFHVHNAHTDGDAMVYFMDSNVLHTGDVFFKGRYPYIDLKNGGSVMGYAKALEKAMLLIQDDTVVIPGHGDLATAKDLEFTKNMLLDLHNQVSKLHTAGKSEAEILKMKNITAKYDALDYGSGFINTERMLQTIYADVTR